MDIGDWLDFFPIGPPGPPGRDRAPEDQAAAGIGTAIFPIVDFLLVLFTGLWRHPAIALAVLPALFSGISFLLCRMLRVGPGWTLVVILGTAAMCAVAGGAAFLLAIFGSFFSGF